MQWLKNAGLNVCLSGEANGLLGISESASSACLAWLSLACLVERGRYVSSGLQQKARSPSAFARHSLPFPALHLNLSASQSGSLDTDGLSRTSLERRRPPARASVVLSVPGTTVNPTRQESRQISRTR